LKLPASPLLFTLLVCEVLLAEACRLALSVEAESFADSPWNFWPTCNFGCRHCPFAL
jgi:hypothetical protein